MILQLQDQRRRDQEMLLDEAGVTDEIFDTEDATTIMNVSEKTNT
jgi:hypothetical protein